MRYLERVYNLFLAFLNYQNNAEFNDSLRISQPSPSFAGSPQFL
jgi:hypothetical protein